MLVLLAFAFPEFARWLSKPEVVKPNELLSGALEDSVDVPNCARTSKGPGRAERERLRDPTGDLAPRGLYFRRKVLASLGRDAAG